MRLMSAGGWALPTARAWPRSPSSWGLQGEVVPASQKDPEGWCLADKFTVVLETAGLNATELGGTCRERVLYVWSRKVVAWDVAEREEALIAADLVSRACLREKISKGSPKPLILHADNGNAMRASTLESRLEELGVLRSYPDRGTVMTTPTRGGCSVP
jgi:transposase InsO family protein